MSRKKPETVNIHASCVQLGAAGRRFLVPRSFGVLLLGESGAGKSELVLRLLHKGARLVADDRVDLYAQYGRLHARPPDALAGLLEIRGLGLVRLRFSATTKVDLVVRLMERETIRRLPQREFYRPHEMQNLHMRRWPPLIEIHNDRAAPARIAMAAAAFSRNLFRHGANP